MRFLRGGFGGRELGLVVAGSLLPVGSAAAQAANPLGNLPDNPLDWAWAIWTAELFRAGDTGIHLNQLVVAGLVVLVGLYVAGGASRVLRARLLKVRGLDGHAAALISRLLYYFLVTIVVLIALPIAGIPITIFTVLSGAVALGIGLGAQNLFANLIAGLTLMVEKPIRLGDIVQVGDHEGRIEEIGNRVTRVRRFDGIDVLVPNSHFLENPVVNWTLFDNRLEGSITVGVAYGSDPNRVAALLRQAAVDHPEVLRDEDVEVYFLDFGADALQFEVEFWANITEPDHLKQVCSDIRFRIDHLFREAGIVMAFPQRDVHLDSARPIEVRVVPEGVFRAA